MEKIVPEGRLHMRPFQFHLKEHWKYPQPLESLLPWTETISAHLDWWQNPTNVMKGSDLHPNDQSIQLFTDASNKGWGAHLEQTSTKGLWSDRKKGYTRVEGGFSGPLKFQGPVSKPNSVVIAPGWAGMPWFWDLVQLSTEQRTTQQWWPT